MVKYFIAILLMAATAFWSSAVARPRFDSVHEIINSSYPYIDTGYEVNNITIRTEDSLKEAQHLSEPIRTMVINLLQEAKLKPWNSVDEYLAEVQPALYRILDGDFDNEVSRRKREKFLEIDGDEIEKNFNEGHARKVISKAPSAYESALKQKLKEALEKNYDSISDFKDKTNDVFENATGIHLNKRTAASEGSSKEEVYREKRQVLVDNDEHEYQSSYEKSVNSQFFYNWYANLLTYAAPSDYRATLKERFQEAMRSNYKSFYNFYMEAVRILNEVTGLELVQNAEEQSIDSPFFYHIYANLLVRMAKPSKQLAILRQLDEKALDGDYKTFDDYQVEAARIFKKFTGTSIEQRAEEIDRYLNLEYS